MAISIDVQNEVAEVSTQEEQATVAMVEGNIVIAGSGDSTVYMRVYSGYIQYSNDNETWKNVVALSEIAGEDGRDGKDGTSVTHEWNGTTLTVTSASGVSSADLKGEKGERGEQGERGERGESGSAGVSATHEWSGTILKITSASGTSSADLKGDKGDRGEAGAAGKDGSDASVTATNIKNALGYTPAKQEDELQLPDYVLEEANNVAADLYSKMSLGNVAVIGFSTDQHIGKYSTKDDDTVNTFGTLYGLKALKELTKKIPFNLAVLGGDYVNSTSVGAIQTEVLMCFEALSDAKCPVVGTVGNHDGWQNNNTITDGDIFKSHTASAVVNYPQFKNLDAISANGYIDDATTNIRYIILDAEPRSAGSTNLTGTITANLTTMLNSMPEGYKAIIFSHKPLNSSLGSDFNDAVDNKAVLEANAIKIICCINGHGHKDASATLNNVLYIQTTCASIERPLDAYDRTVGTANETVFDVFVVDQSNNKIHAIRYGAGGNREFDIPVVAAYTNVLPLAIDSDGSVFNGTGYQAKSRLSSSGGISSLSVTSATNPAFTTGFIKLKNGDVVRLKNCYIDTVGFGGDGTVQKNYYGHDIANLRIGVYDMSFAFKELGSWSTFKTWSYVTPVVDSEGYCRQFTINSSGELYMRFVLGGVPEEAIITINEEIN